MNDKSVVSCALALTLWGCSSGTPGPATDGGSSTPNGGPTGATAGPGASASAGPVAPPAGEIESELVAVAALPYDVNLYAFEGAVVGYGTTFDETVQGIPMGFVENDKFVSKKELAIPGYYAIVVGLGGKWPQGVDLLVTGTTGRTSIAQHYALSAEGGWQQKLYRESTYFAGVAEVGGSVLAYQTNANFPSMQPEIKTLRGPKLVRTPAPLDKACEKEMLASGQPANWFPRTDLRPEAFGATRGGALVAIGYRVCNDTPHAEVWETGSTTSRIIQLPPKRDPKAQVDAAIVPGAADNEAYLVYGGVSKFDGKTVTALPQPPRDLVKVAVGSGGALYGMSAAVTHYDTKQGKQVTDVDAQLFRFDGKAWAVVPLPLPPVSMAGTRDGTLWVSSGRTLLRSRKSAGEKSTVAVEPGAAGGGIISKNPRKAPRAAGPLCPSNLVVLYGFTKVTPDDYDFPLTRKALKGQTQFDKTRFVVAKDGGQKFFSAIVPDVATGRKLVARIEKEVQGSKPQLLCAEPEIVREVKLDLKTGEVAK